MKSDKLKEKYNLICVVMDRVDSAVNYLNNHDEFPKTEEDFVCFLVYACMVKDAITKLYESVFHKKKALCKEPSIIYNSTYLTFQDCVLCKAFVRYRALYARPCSKALYGRLPFPHTQSAVHK